MEPESRGAEEATDPPAEGDGQLGVPLGPDSLEGHGEHHRQVPVNSVVTDFQYNISHRATLVADGIILRGCLKMICC